MTDSGGPLLIGVDGGGSGCRAVIARAPSVPLAQVTGGPANLTTDFDLAMANVARTIDTAMRQAGLTSEDLADAVAHVGLAGTTTETLARKAEAALALPRCRVGDDRATTVEGALGDGDGFVLAIGTGTIVAARRAGALGFVGGWGLNLSDQASGGWIGRRALHDTLLAHDGLLPTSGLSDALLARFDGPAGIVAFAASAGPAEYAALTPDIFAAAAARDTRAVAILEDGAAYLVAALSVLGMTAGDRLCLSGGVGRHYRPFLPDALTAGLVAPEGNALDGALRLAARAARA